MSRVGIVTGGTRGIGKAISIELSEAGHKVAATYAGNDQAAEEFSKATGIATYKFDVAVFDECAAAVKKIAEDLGGPVQILINNAGITRDSTLHRMGSDDWNAVLQTNLTSCYNMCRNVIEDMRESEFGRIVNIGSINGQAGQYGQVNYAAAKSGIHGFTKALAQENAAKGITVNAIGPGFIDTDMATLPDGSGHEHDTEWFKEIYIKHGRIPLRRAGKPDDIAGPAFFLCSDDSQYVTGQILLVDGGVSATF